MNLTDDQKQIVQGWLEANASISEVQKRLKEELNLPLTYMDTRFLIDDLKLKLAEPPPEPEKPAEEAEVLPPEPEEELPPVGGGKVSVTIDQITKPSALISGKVTFSDGQKAEWMLDQMGRLSLNPDVAGYRPAQEDVMAFQMELQRLARSQGY